MIYLPAASVDELPDGHTETAMRRLLDAVLYVRDNHCDPITRPHRTQIDLIWQLPEGETLGRHFTRAWRDDLGFVVQLSDRNGTTLASCSVSTPKVLRPEGSNPIEDCVDLVEHAVRAVTCGPTTSREELVNVMVGASREYIRQLVEKQDPRLLADSTFSATHHPSWPWNGEYVSCNLGSLQTAPDATPFPSVLTIAASLPGDSHRRISVRLTAFYMRHTLSLLAGGGIARLRDAAALNSIQPSAAR